VFDISLWITCGTLPMLSMLLLYAHSQSILYDAMLLLGLGSACFLLTPSGIMPLFILLLITIKKITFHYFALSADAHTLLISGLAILIVTILTMQTNSLLTLLTDWVYNLTALICIFGLLSVLPKNTITKRVRHTKGPMLS
jgi:hypothetical protein